MNPEIKDLIEISRYFGNNKEYAIAGGGNTSYKEDAFIWIKASGVSLASVDENSFVKLSREKLQRIISATYSDKPMERETQVKADLLAAIEGIQPGRPSVETSMHETIRYPFVVHTHPTRINGLLCAKHAKETVYRLFGETALYIEYTDPGYILFKKAKERIDQYQETCGKDPRIVFLENHGVFVSGNSIGEIRKSYEHIEKVLKAADKRILPAGDLPLSEKIMDVLPAVRMLFTETGSKVIRIRHNKLIANYYASRKAFEEIQFPFAPDHIVYAKSKYLYVEETGSPESIVSAIQKKLRDYRKEKGFMPVIVLVKGLGLIAVEDNWTSAGIALDIFEDMMKITYYSQNYGGPRFLSKKDIRFIETWEVENYRKQLSAGTVKGNRVDHKIIIITGAAQGFGEGICRNLMENNANVVIADINVKKGQALANELNSKGRKNRALFVKTDVSDAGSVQHLMAATVAELGGLDVLVSNAGILCAGDLDEMDAKTFERMTRINYNGYFLCVKYASAILKTQARYHDSYFTDIIQINSKSGLKGSNRNFTYAGSKFGGIGLTQSFAMELMPSRIKVNAVCPGNFFDGPLWSDPVNGLFVQYLKAGKVPGAKTTDDIKKHYEAQIPAGRGCSTEDVMKALYYAIDQQYETGQAIPVTGGQVMLR
jgi:NAD(P)-dependent dehydrogenase (short-subunit alcohol dehydrogenase family)/rhamnose utilization protein RhaD (predicted bifunctional aldolase and dehydrogenase)